VVRRIDQLRLPEKKMAKKTNELQDLVQQIEDLIADLAHLQDPQIKELPNGVEQKLGEAKGRIVQESGPPQA
jgi:ElaB/YqjD/DUF883 family membrane-anchored ribosome-binding protein